MKFISIILLIFTFSISSQAKDLIQLPDIAPTTEDIQSPSQLEAIEKELFDQFTETEDVSIYSEYLNFHRGYGHIDPNGIVPQDLLNSALSFFDRYKSKFRNQKYITVVDFSKRSNLKRFFVINMHSGKVYPFRTTHGANSDRNNDGYVESVSNVSGSKQSSKGFYKVAEVYHGKYGRSVRLDGLSSSNSRARSRAIVIHGADYIKEANVKQGRSWGCFALSWKVKDSIVSAISGGSLLYADFSR